jgi:hypothetical protein
MEKVVTKDGEFFRNKLSEEHYPYFLMGDSTIPGISYSKYRWIDRAYLSNFPNCNPNEPFLNFVSEKYYNNNELASVKGYLWQDAARLSHIVKVPIYIHFTSLIISEPTSEFEIYFLANNEVEYEDWIASKGFPTLTENTGMYRYLHSLKINKLTEQVISNKSYYRNSPFDSYSEIYKTVEGHTVRRGY